MKEKLRDESWLRQKYLLENKSQREISDIVGCSYSGVHYYIEKYNINKNYKYKDKTWLKKKHEEGLNCGEIADLCRASQSTISRLLRKHSISQKADFVSCPGCEDDYISLSSHWNHNEDCRPSFTEKQREIITGILMSDGTLDGRENIPRLTLPNKQENYLEYISDIFGCLTTQVRKDPTKNDSCMMYEINTRKHPELKQYSEWYESGKKVWPEDIELTPTTLKHLFVCDGSTHFYKPESPSIIIAMANEYGNEDKIKNMFQRIGFEISNIISYKSEDGRNNMNIQFDTETSLEMFEYMGSSLPGFEYKWPGE